MVRPTFTTVKRAVLQSTCQNVESWRIFE